MARGAPAPSDRALVLGIAATQFIGWGTLFVPFPLLLAPMEAELGWSRALINGAYTAGLLLGGIAAIPVGRWIDRHGARGMMSWTAFAGAAMLLGWSRVTEPAELYLVWLGIGLAQAGCLWGPAMAVMVALARDATRSITAITFITGVTSTAFLPLADALIGALGWRGALAALAALQLVPGVVTLWLLRGAPRPAPPAAGQAAARPLRAAMRGPAFAGLALSFAAHAFVATGLGAHLIPLLRERGLAEAVVLTLAALHGPGQVAARAALYFGGARLGGVRGVGVVATALLAVAMLALALAGQSLAVTLLFVLCLAAADGLLTIVRATGVMEILGRAGYGAVTGALTTIAVLPRTLAPLALALIWQEAGGYAPVPWLLLAVAAAGCAAFIMAARATPAASRGGDHPIDG